ncbi:MAG: hypothetical protein U5K28_03635 [Halobacteriales archaeon]|nr:hypothetical protein [Halobacteriales archaeon]
MYMGRDVEDPRAKLIVVSVMSVSAVSIVSYTGLASGLTISVLEMPDGTCPLRVIHSTSLAVGLPMES